MQTKICFHFYLYYFSYTYLVWSTAFNQSLNVEAALLKFFTADMKWSVSTCKRKISCFYHSFSLYQAECCLQNNRSFPSYRTLAKWDWIQIAMRLGQWIDVLEMEKKVNLLKNVHKSYWEPNKWKSCSNW